MIQSWRAGGWPGILGNDLASVTTHHGGARFLLLSEASALISDYDRGGQLLGALPLRAGHAGLQRSVPQPEGLAVGPDGTIYLVSEPNLFYRFRRSGSTTVAGCCRPG